ncbi:MAG: hypothetical protein ABJQ41_03125 [Marinomonas sp.]
MTSLLYSVSSVLFSVQMSLLFIWLYQGAYARHKVKPSKAASELLVPAFFALPLSLVWVVGVGDAIYNSQFTFASVWVWWMPIGACVVFYAGRRFARWNICRLREKNRNLI